jgi:hypothetical protein
VPLLESIIAFVSCLPVFTTKSLANSYIYATVSSVSPSQLLKRFNVRYTCGCPGFAAFAAKVGRDTSTLALL